MSEWTWLGTLGVGLLVGFALGRWATRRENAGAPTWHGIPQSVVSGVRAYMTLIYLLAAIGIGFVVIKDVMFPDQSPASSKDPARYPGSAIP
jgi:hypothetical protein